MKEKLVMINCLGGIRDYFRLCEKLEEQNILYRHDLSILIQEYLLNEDLT